MSDQAGTVIPGLTQSVERALSGIVEEPAELAQLLEDLRTAFISGLPELEAIIRERDFAHELLRRAQESARVDSLTGLLNRSAIKDVIEEEVHAKFGVDTPLYVMFMDCNGFKEINDSHGHKVGDAVLQEVAKRLSQTDGLAFRIGGDEFVVIVPAFRQQGMNRPGEEHRAGETDPNAYIESVLSRVIEDMATSRTQGDPIKEMLLRIEDAVSRDFQSRLEGKHTVDIDGHDDIEVDISLSIGCIYTRNSSLSEVFSAIALADEKMYQDKETRKALITKAKDLEIIRRHTGEAQFREVFNEDSPLGEKVRSLSEKLIRADDGGFRKASKPGYQEFAQLSELLQENGKSDASRFVFGLSTGKAVIPTENLVLPGTSGITLKQAEGYVR